MLRSILAVVAGYIAVSLLETAGHYLFASMPPAGAASPVLGIGAALILLYEVLINFAGGVITGLIAPRRQVLHAAVLGMIETALLLSVPVWMTPTGVGWFAVAMILIPLPAVVAGGRLAVRISPAGSRTTSDA
jgi:hypothetical protein